MTRYPACCAVFMALVLTGPLAAQSPTDRMFPDDRSCYAREYGIAHLASHPQQQATSIALTPQGRSPDGLSRQVWVTATVRSMPGKLEALAYCENISDQLYCQMEGDAGAFALTVARDGAVLLAVSSRGMTFEGETGFVTFERSRGDDRSFLLRPTADCR
jgi:hypothetical protein